MGVPHDRRRRVHDPVAGADQLKECVVLLAAADGGSITETLVKSSPYFERGSPKRHVCPQSNAPERDSLEPPARSAVKDPAPAPQAGGATNALVETLRFRLETHRPHVTSYRHHGGIVEFGGQRAQPPGVGTRVVV